MADHGAARVEILHCSSHKTLSGYVSYKSLHTDTLEHLALGSRKAYKGTVEEDEVSFWWRIRKEMEDLHVP
jgi:hypothetical protein